MYSQMDSLPLAPPEGYFLAIHELIGKLDSHQGESLLKKPSVPKYEDRRGAFPVINLTKMEILQPTLQRSKPEMGSEIFILKKNPR